MLELLLGMTIGAAIGTYNHDKMEPCLQPVMEELVAMKDRIQAKIEIMRSQRLANANIAPRPNTGAQTGRS